MKKLAIVTTHPIQYNAPFFRLLNERGKVYPKVFYTWPQAIKSVKDIGFGEEIEWDIPLLNGYEWEVVENVSKNPGSKSWDGINCPTLISRVLEFNPDAVFVYGWNLKSHYGVMRYFKGKIPVWFFGDSTLLDEKWGIKKLARRAWLYRVYKNIDKAFYVGANNKDYFLSHGVEEKQLVFFPHAIENERFYDDENKQYEKKAKEWRERLGYGEDDLIILFAGKFEPKKNPLLLIKSVKQVNSQLENKNNPIRLIMVGNGPLEIKLKQICNDDPNIKFLPFQNQSVMPIVYRLGDVFCLPSKGPGETWGLAVNEAMACGRPLIISNKVGCGRDLVRHGYNGIIFNSDIELVEAIHSLLLGNQILQSGMVNRRLISDWNYKVKCESVEQQLLLY